MRWGVLIDMSERRWQVVEKLWETNQWLYLLVGFGAGVAAFPLLNMVATVPGDLSGNLVAELIGIGFTVLFIDRLYQRRERLREEKKDREKLIQSMGSPDNATAVNAVRRLRSLGYIQNGTLRGMRMLYANLEKTNLFRGDCQEMNLGHATLTGANMVESKLCNAYLRNATLKDAKLMKSDLTGAKLLHADCEGTVFAGAKLRNAELIEVNFKRANLRRADLTGAKLMGATFDEYTILPDGTRWTPNADIKRFISTRHPDYKDYSRT